ncbi:integrin alpha-IIb [Aplochiton taeniatus]
MYIVIGAPKANTSQPGVREGGGVYLCPWSPGGGTCDVIDFDLKGDETYTGSVLHFQSFKSNQWFGASVRSAQGHILACAPLFHWNVMKEKAESQNTPVGNCFLLDQITGDSTPFSPCRDILVEADYKALSYINDRRYCEAGFSSDITKDGRVVLGAPGGFYFQGQVITATVSDIVKSGQSQAAIRYVAGVSQSLESSGGYDRYHGYSVASGQLTGDSVTDYLVGVPNDRNTAGSVKIYNGAYNRLTEHHAFQGPQVASYFGHSVAVSDINGDGLDDVLVGAPLFMERVAGQLQELGQVSVYLQRGHAHFPSRPDQCLSGVVVYGRFGSALAPLGDLDMDGYNDVVVGSPWAGKGGQVSVYLGNADGLSATPSQVINSPSPSNRAAFGFSLRGGTDVDGNGYPDLSQSVIRTKTQLSLYPDFLNPEVKRCELQSSNQPVACFTIQMCVHVSGHSIPQEIVLEAELQLDKMKQPMARRTLLLSTNQPLERFQLTIQREVGVACGNQTAYLRPEAEVRDKLSPIFISVNYSLSLENSNSQGAVLHGQKAAMAQTRIILDCGEDNVCVPELKLSAKSGTEGLVVGEDHPVLLLVSAENHGEGAYETELEIRPPRHTHYQSVRFSRLVCVQRKENQTVLVVCELGNPMKPGTMLQAGLFFSVGHLEEVESHVSFTLKITSKNRVNPNSNVVTVKMKVTAEASLEIRGGSSPPEVVLPLPDWLPLVHPGNLDEIGPLVEHVYELRNLGPSMVSARLQVDFPSRQRGHFLFYVFANATEDFLSCSAHGPDIDPYGLASNSTVAAVPVIDQEEEPEAHSRDSVHVNCSSGAECVRFVCDTAELERGWSAVVRISARLWIHTFTQRPYVNYDLVSQASYEVINTSSKVQPLLPSHGQTETQTSVLWRGPDGEREVPVGWVVLSIISGLLLLALLCFIFWKVGFFNRTRPPSEDDEEEEQLANMAASIK